MPDNNIPECLSQRYKILDNLVKDLANIGESSSSTPQCSNNASPNDAAVKLMCDFWKILKENPDCDLSQIVKERMGLVNKESSTCFNTHDYQCYMAEKCNKDKMEGSNSHEIFQKIKSLISEHSNQKEPKPRCCQSSKTKIVPPNAGSDNIGLTKVLSALKKAESFELKCNVKLYELKNAEKKLKEEISKLENIEKERLTLLKKADCMWTCMENTYKYKICEALERQKPLLIELDQVDKSTVKWRKSKKELDIHLSSIDKCHQDIIDKFNIKSNDLKYTNNQVEVLKKKIESAKNETLGLKNSFSIKKQASDEKCKNFANEISRLGRELAKEIQYKANREKEGEALIKEAREELNRINKAYIQKKLELKALLDEKESAIEDVEMLQDTMDTCKMRCKNKKDSIAEEINKIKKEIAEFKVQCIQCHQCSSTMDVRKLCTDCPKCAQGSDCLYDKEKCFHDQSLECICMKVKSKLLDNVFDNMYTVLERKIKTGPGKAVAEAVLQCLKKSKNGKINSETRKILQDFILTTVKKNLNLTIVGGAIKTRCEMERDTYNQLMLCLKDVKSTKPPKADKSTIKKEPCKRWGGTSECNCPKGPKDCICGKRGPKLPNEPRSSPPTPPDKEDEEFGAATCPHKGSICGPECALHSIPDDLEDETDQVIWKPSPCKEKSCPFSKNMRAAQCVLGPETLINEATSPEFLSSMDLVPTLLNSTEVNCTCATTPKALCPCHGDSKQMKVATGVQLELIKTCDDAICDIFQRSIENIEDEERLLLSQDINEAFENEKQGEDKVQEIKLKPEQSVKDTVATKAKYVRVRLPVGSADEGDSLILIPTNSGNFIIKFNKEFEKPYIHKINEIVGKENKCDVKLSKTKSNNYLINFDKSGPNKEDAQLIKSLSGVIKVLKIKKANSKESSSISTSLFNDSLETLSTKILCVDEMTCNKATLVNTVHSDYYDNRDIQLRLSGFEQNDINTVGIIRKHSGYYIIQFTDLANFNLSKLKTFLSVYHKCYIPIRMNKSRQTISLLLSKNRNMLSDEMYGLLKVTPSNNILIVIDEGTMGRMKKDAKVVPSSHHMIEPINDPVHKCLNTSCNARAGKTIDEFCCKGECACASLPKTIKKYWLPLNKDSTDEDFKQENTVGYLSSMQVNYSTDSNSSNWRYYSNLNYNNMSRRSSSELTRSIPDSVVNIPYLSVNKHSSSASTLYSTVNIPELSTNVSDSTGDTHDLFTNIPLQLPYFLRSNL